VFQSDAFVLRADVLGTDFHLPIRDLRHLTNTPARVCAPVRDVLESLLPRCQSDIREEIIKTEMRPLRIFAVVLGVLLIGAQQPSKTLKLSPQGYVNDFAGVINLETRQKLETLCGEVDQKAHAQIAIVTVASLNGESVDQFTIDLAMGWGIGPKGTKRGVLILLAPSEHKYRIEVGYGLEPILPDGKVGTIGREAVPLLRDGDYSRAVMLMTRRAAETIAADQNITLSAFSDVPSPPAQKSSHNGGNLGLLGIVFLIIFIAWVLPRFFRGPGYRGRRGGGGGFVGPWFLGGGGGGFGGGMGGGGSWGGGGGGSGGGFGGFGGGSFGGGGASGSW
jgi:uncharacterized protein